MTRTAKVVRATAETDIGLSIDLDGTGAADVETGVGFFDHMLCALARHSMIDLTLRVKGDTYVDDHHTVEDTGIVLGQALREALGDKRGIRRFGSVMVPLDELGHEFFAGLARDAGITLHLRLVCGENAHHILEATFKAFARALREAVEPDFRSAGAIPSTKGSLS